MNKFWSQPLYRIVLLCALPAGLIPLLEYLAICPFGSSIFLQLEIFMLLPCVAALLAILVAPVLLFKSRHRPLAARVLLAAVVFVTATCIGVPFGKRIRTAAFQNLAERSAPFVQAILEYESRYGMPPAALADLVPEFLPAIPGTSMEAYPDYEYHVGAQANGFEGNPWVLTVFTPSGGINFDQFMYFPLQNYPERGYGGSLERIGDWAYVHE